MRYVSWILVFTLIGCSDIFAARLIEGNVDTATNTTFNFSIGVQKSGTLGQNVFIGAQAPGAQEYALAYYLSSGTSFMPLAQMSAQLNGQKDVPNPLFNRGIPFLGLLDQDRPVVVPDDLISAYVVQQTITLPPLPDSQEMQVIPEVYGVSEIKDAQGATTGGVVGLGAHGAVVLTAVKGAGETTFGTGNSGIALLEIFSSGAQNAGSYTFAQLDGQGGLGQQRAQVLNLSSSQLAIGSPLGSLGTIVDIHFDPDLIRWYIAVDGVSGATAGSGIKSLFIAYLSQVTYQLPLTQQNQTLAQAAFESAEQENIDLEVTSDQESTKEIECPVEPVETQTIVAPLLVLAPIAPDAIFTDDQIVGILGTDQRLNISRVRSMVTSTSLNYVIIVRDVPGPQSIFALPVVNNRTNVKGAISNQLEQGTLAARDQTPTIIYSQGEIPFFFRREFLTPATQAGQAYIPTDTQVQVGGGPLLAGSISDIFVVNDVVYASVAQAAPGQQPGLFYSRALFDSTGAIVAWTTWQRIGGTVLPLYFASAQIGQDQFYLTTGSSAASVNTVLQTQWGPGSSTGRANLIEVINSQLPFDQGGIAGFYDFPVTTPGLSGISLTVSTGINAVVLALTGETINGSFVPVQGDFYTDSLIFENGIITQTLPLPGTDPHVVTIKGGVLGTLGIITAAEVARTQDRGFLFVGGINGVAVLLRPDGSDRTWDISAGELGNGFTGLVTGTQFVSVGNYTFVRSLIADDNYLYVLTDQQLDRIDLTASNFQAGALVVTTLARAQELVQCSTTPSLLSALVSEKLALVSTSGGVFHIGYGKDVRTVTDSVDASWQPLILPAVAYPTIQFIPVSITGRAQDVSRGTIGNLYFLNTYRGGFGSTLSRAVINNTVVAPVSPTTIEQRLDEPIQNIYAYFGQFPAARDLFGFDSAAYLNTRNKTVVAPVRLFNGFRSPTFVLDNLRSTQAVSVGTIASAGLGYIAGQFGLMVNE